MSVCNYNECFSTLQSLFRAWLDEKEKALNEVKTNNFKDSGEINTNVRQLAVSIRPVLCSYWQQMCCKY